MPLASRKLSTRRAKPSSASIRATSRKAKHKPASPWHAPKTSHYESPPKMPKHSKRQQPDQPQFSPVLVAILSRAIDATSKKRLQFIIPEVLLSVMISTPELAAVLRNHKIKVDPLLRDLDSFIETIEKVPAKRNYTPGTSVALRAVFQQAANLAAQNDDLVIPPYVFEAIFALDRTDASRILREYVPARKLTAILDEYIEAVDMLSEEAENAFPDPDGWSDDPDFDADSQADDQACHRLDNDPLFDGSHFCGRTDDIRRAVMTLLKSRRGNIIFVGDRGVGKSAMIEGLIKASKSSFDPKSRFGSARFYKLNPSAIVTGVSYTDEIENHVADIIADINESDASDNKDDKPTQKSMAVIFADNMAELMPQNQNDNTPDTLRLLTSLTEGSDIHIVTTATFEQYKRLAQHNTNVEKNFTRIDLAEPKIDPDCRDMVRKAHVPIAQTHNITLAPSVLDYVVDAAISSYSKDSAMPGRAIDLLDSVCAYVEMQSSAKSNPESRQIDNVSVDKYLKAMGFDNIAAQAGREERLRELEPTLLTRIFGQDEAVHGVAQSVLLAKAGLSDDSKPLASYLFVGPTGVGKTELAKVLAQELGTKLIRFDMSEYSEQHTVSKLVGSPAGYVGYDDGGLLTDAVRKNPNCVLLFDEIEKAHSAVFNLLLQVLDYAKLTDNKGQKADFSGAIIIMTSNAGARFATGTGLGFGAKSEKSEVMGAELKRVFTPEFLNRLTQIVPFHDMSLPMAERILDRKVAELQSTLSKKRSVSFALSPEARNLLLHSGFSSHYGAREMDRAIGRLLKPALMEALLFGTLPSAPSTDTNVPAPDEPVLPTLQVTLSPSDPNKLVAHP